MGFYRKLPVVVEAEQFHWESESTEGLSPEFWSALSRPPVGWPVTIKTLEGDHQVMDGDWIIKGVAGEFYSCKPDIFAKTYEHADPMPA